MPRTSKGTDASASVDTTKHDAHSRATRAGYVADMVEQQGRDHPGRGRHVVVVGAGMVAHRFVESLRSRDPDGLWRVTVIGEEDRHPYDRVGLTSYFAGASADDLTLQRSILDDDDRVRFVRGDAVARIDREARRVTTESGLSVGYDTLVLATGSYAARLTVDGFDLTGCFVYRTLDDVEGLRAFVERRSAELGRPLRGTVIGGGLLGLEAAGAMQGLDVDCTVVQSSDRLMSAQLDARGADSLRRLIESRGIAVRTGSVTTRLDPDIRGNVRGLEFREGDYADTDVVVFTVGVRPRDQLARAAELKVDPRGGVIIDAECTTSDPRILAIGEVASFDGRCVGLVAPGYAMAEVAATRLLGSDSDVPRVRRLDQAQAQRRGCRELRRRLRHRRPVRSMSSTPTRWPASTRSSCSPTTRRRCSAASWSAMRVHTGCCAPSSADRSAPTPPRTSCPRAPAMRSRMPSCPTKRWCARATASRRARSAAP